MIEMPGSLVGINTLIPNRLVRAGVLAGRIPGLADYDALRPEVPYGRNSRIDLLLERGEARCFIEIKNCTLLMDGIAYFPDAVTSRGLKHLHELEREVRLGHRAVIFFLIQRMDASLFKPADSIDPAYGKALRKAARTGVVVMAYDVTLDLERVTLNGPVPVGL
jgi:sugar fermentation stimulation protein A